MSTTIEHLKQTLKSHACPQAASQLRRFFKTGKGEYSEHEQFLGIKVPTLRQFAKRYQHLSLTELGTVISSPLHEERFLALLILINQYKTSNHKKTQKTLYQFYINNKQFVNNWDLVDLSAPAIIGVHLYNKNRSLLKKLAQQNNLWDRRIAIVATWHFIRHDDFDDTLELAHLLLTDEEDLIHKAVGWMLREVGKRNQDLLEQFITRHYDALPRTTLRYAIERFPENQRKKMLKRTRVTSQ